MEEGLIRSTSKAVNFASVSFEELKIDISRVHDERLVAEKKLQTNEILKWVIFIMWIFTFYIKKVKELKENKFKEVEVLKDQISKTYIEVNFTEDKQREKAWLDVLEAFDGLKASQKIWDLTFNQKVDKVQLRSIADSAVHRKEIKLSNKELNFLRTDLEPIRLPNTNGPDIYIYPEFLLMHKTHKEIGIFDIKAVNFLLEFTGFVETEKVSKDSEVIDYTWAKTNKNGTADKRFKDNYQIPILKYGQMVIQSEDIIQEAYMFSNTVAYDEFIKAFNRFLKVLKT